MELFSGTMEGITQMERQEDRSSRNSSSSDSSVFTSSVKGSSSEKSRLLDITRDKPIKVAVRVAVPVRDHPKFNFVGKLLGPKGNSMKRLQEDTMCKMAVLGRGSMKDRKKEEELRLSGDPRYSHLSEDLHVEISTFAAPAEAHARIAYALAEVRRFLVPDYHDDIRQEQMWEMQALSSSQNQSQEISNASTHSNSTTDLLVGGEAELNGTSECCTSGGANGVVTSMAAVTSATLPAAPSSSILMISGTNGELEVANALTPHQPSPAVVNDLVAAAAAAGGTVIPATVSALTPNNSILTIAPGETIMDTHPALRVVKAVNIGNLARKRPLLGVPRSSMNPTKRTVMTLLARAKNAQALHSTRGGVASALGEEFYLYS
ncbi:KH domain-containing, RNA-binding, signal transduction-associated protein 2 isoform X3 [Lutzomyia longipalpis]|uniref:KH domain-containing, RNA-binding, signal transduction-associated protein 2 isoform X3 n=1 Tax=Lutzomyia longipalpis TaxID=7200 RepID=UPI0024847300|nr:KH domain-containing, RNA-binding, signal transduction-associated protein 2 isoform X3 [Lutzomyia longipalpis]